MFLRSFARSDSTLLVFGMARLDLSLPILDFGFIGSAFSLRGHVQLEPTLSAYGMTRLELSLSVLDPIRLDSALSPQSQV